MMKKEKADTQSATLAVYKIACVHLATLLSILLPALFCSCSNDSSVVTMFPTEKKLKADAVDMHDSIYSAYAIMSDGSNYILTQKRSDNFFVVTNSTFKKTGELCAAGHGNNEWTAPIATRQFCTHNGEECIYVLERPSHTLYMQPVKGGDRIKDEDFNIRGLTSIRYTFKTSDNTYIGALDDNKSETFVYNKTTKEIKSFPHPLIDMDEVGDMSQMLLQTNATYSPTVQKMAACYFSYPIIAIRDSNGNITSAIQVEKDLPHYNHENAGDSHIYFKDIQSDNKNIYALYSSPSSSTCDYILVFTWSGEPVAKYAISPSSAFTVANKGNRIIAIDEEIGTLKSYTME